MPLTITLAWLVNADWRVLLTTTTTTAAIPSQEMTFYVTNGVVVYSNVAPSLNGL